MARSFEATTNFEYFTHYLVCFENVGNEKKRRYFDLCKIIRIGKNNKPYLLVKSSRGNKIVKRYGEFCNLIPIYESY